MTVKEITVQDREWVLEANRKWYSRDRADFLASEEFVGQQGRRSVSRFRSPRSDRVVTVVTEYGPGARLAVACDCPSFQYRKRCRHVAAVVWAYHRWAVKG